MKLEERMFARWLEWFITLGKEKKKPVAYFPVWRCDEIFNKALPEFFLILLHSLNKVNYSLQKFFLEKEKRDCLLQGELGLSAASEQACSVSRLDWLVPHLDFMTAVGH